MPYKHAMTIFDGTPASEDLLDMVCRIVRPHRALLTILHVRLLPLIEELHSYQKGVDPELDAQIRRAEKFADKRGVKAASAARYARNLGSAVVDEARSRGVDLIALLAPDIDKTCDERLGREIEIVLRKATSAIMLCRPSR